MKEAEGTEAGEPGRSRERGSAVGLANPAVDLLAYPKDSHRDKKFLFPSELPSP